MKLGNKIRSLLALVLCLSMFLSLFGCGSVEFEVDFVVEGEVYATIKTNGNETIRIPADPTKEGYIFAGWFWDYGEWTQPFTANSLLDAPLSSNMSVHAKFVKIGGNPDEDITTGGNGSGGDESDPPAVDTVTYKVTVKDAQGAPIAGVRLQICSKTTGICFVPQLVTDASGVATTEKPEDAYEISIVAAEGYVFDKNTKISFEGNKTELIIVLDAYVPDEPDEPTVTESTIAQVLAGDLGATYQVTGTVVGVNAQSFLLKDSTGMILVYKGSTWTADVSIGDNVTVNGASATYGNAVQFGTTATYTVNSNGTFTHPTPSELTAAQIDAYKDINPITPAYVKLTGVLSVSGNYFNLAIDGATLIGSLTYLGTTDKEAVTALNSKTITVDGYVTGVSGGGQYLNLMVTAYAAVEEGDTPDQPEVPDVPEVTDSTIAQVIAGDLGATYQVTGTVVGVNAQSFLLKDSTGMILVYKGSTWTADVAIGDNVTVNGASATYGNAIQFGTTATYTVNFNGTFTQPTPEELTATQIDAYKDINPITPAYVKLTGVLSVSGNYFNLAIDGATLIGSLTYLGATDKEAVTALNGKTITVDGYVTGVSGGGKYLNLMVTAYAEVAGGETPDQPDTPEAPEAVTAPVAGVEYYFALTQENLGKTLYINGEMSTYYYATTENADEAIKVVLETVDGKEETYYLYAMINGVKTYLNIIKDGSYTNVVYGETAISEYVFNTDYNTLTTVLEGVTYYFGTYNNYQTFSAGKLEKIANSFAAHLYEIA